MLRAELIKIFKDRVAWAICLSLPFLVLAFVLLLLSTPSRILMAHVTKISLWIDYSNWGLFFIAIYTILLSIFLSARQTFLEQKEGAIRRMLLSTYSGKEIFLYKWLAQYIFLALFLWIASLLLLLGAALLPWVHYNEEILYFNFQQHTYPWLPIVVLSCKILILSLPVGIVHLWFNFRFPQWTLLMLFFPAFVSLLPWGPYFNAFIEVFNYYAAQSRYISAQGFVNAVDIKVQAPKMLYGKALWGLGGYGQVTLLLTLILLALACIDFQRNISKLFH